MGREVSHDPQFQVLLLPAPCFEVQLSSQWGQIRIRGLDSPGETDFPVPALLCVAQNIRCLYFFSRSVFTNTGVIATMAILLISK